MAPHLFATLPFFVKLPKSCQATCPHCHWAGPCPRYGFYHRADPSRPWGRIKVQRYLCPNPRCSAVTFSCLPPLVLPIIRMTATLLWLMATLAPSVSVRRLSRLIGCSRSTIRRRVAWADRLGRWLHDLGRPLAVTSWAAFCHLISQAFFPGRWPSQAINTTRPVPGMVRVS